MEYNARETIFVPGVYIHIHEDTLRVWLSDHLKLLEGKNHWTTPFSMLTTIGITLVTSEFQDSLLSASTWKRIFIIIGVFSVIWLIYSLRKRRKVVTIDDMIKNLIERSQK